MISAMRQRLRRWHRRREMERAASEAAKLASELAWMRANIQLACEQFREAADRADAEAEMSAALPHITVTIGDLRLKIRRRK
jgi:hypothetical protein